MAGGLEKQAIINFHLKNPLEGYRRLTFMMLDADIVAVSPSSVWRVLGQEGLLKKWNGKPSKKGTGFEQPPQPHQHWHIDVSYINISGTFYYLCSVLDGYSRFIVHWDLRESMTEAEIEVILQGAKEKHLEAKPRIISDNGPQFIARDFKEFIRISGMTHVRTSPYYPQSNGKLERWHKSLKSECIRPGTPLTPEDARRLIQQYVDRYHTVRLTARLDSLRRPTCWPGVRRRSTRRETASWRKHGSSGRSAGSRRRDRESYNDFARRNGSGLCRDATRPRDSLAGSSRRCRVRKFAFRALPPNASDR